MFKLNRRTLAILTAVAAIGGGTTAGVASAADKPVNGKVTSIGTAPSIQKLDRMVGMLLQKVADLNAKLDAATERLDAINQRTADTAEQTAAIGHQMYAPPGQFTGRSLMNLVTDILVHVEEDD
jgi:hypothetical protein